MYMNRMKNRDLVSILFLSLILCIACMAKPDVSHARDAGGKTVRVGWFDSSFCYYDQFGRRCGIDYEYQHKISAYTGWTYEYVEDSWPNLFQMLKDGEIDLLSDVSYKPERAEQVLFPDLPMGTESYYIYIAAENRDIKADNLASFNGKRIGVNQGSIQEGFLKEWEEKNHLSLEIVPLVADEDDSMEMVTNGEIDGYASIYSFSSGQKVTPVCRVGASEYYYAVSRNRPDLLEELNMALSGIQDEDPYFNQRLTQERLYNTRTNAFLSPVQEDWLEEHGAIRIGYLDQYLPFCGTDSETGELTGALKDYLVHAANSLRSTDIQFETVPYPSTEAAMKAMKAGEVDCVFPVYLSSYDSEEQNVRLTSPTMKTEVNVIMRSSNSQELSRDSKVTFALLAGDLNTETFIMDRYPASDRKTLDSIEKCYLAVASGDADCVAVSNYRLPSAEEIFGKYALISVPTGESMQFSFAVNSADRELYFLLNKTALMTRSEDMDSSLASYMHFNQKVSFTRFLRDNWIIVLSIISAVFLLIVLLLLQRLKAERRLNEQQRMMEDGLRRELQQKEQLQTAMKMAYTDPLTGVKSKNAYKEAEEQMDQRISQGTVSEFSVIVFDLNDLKQINDSRGHDAGDEYIRNACRMICTTFKHSPVFRIGGDEFTAIVEGEDYSKQDELLDGFEKQVLVNLKRGGTVVSFGCSRFQPRNDTSIRTVFERADAAMYKEKELLKSLGTSVEKDAAEKESHSQLLEDISVANLRKHILIADDVEGNREIMGDLLQEDYDIIYASDGIETMELLRSRRDEIALLILDLYMPNMTGQEVMAQMQIDEELMSIPVVVLTVDQDAELECLRMGAMDFIPKPYPDAEIVKARIAKCIELSENRDLIRRTMYEKLTGLFNVDYFMRYVNRYDQYYKDVSFDAVFCDIRHFHSVNKQYGRQFGDLVLRTIGISMKKLTRKTGGIGCRKEGGTFLLYFPHQEDCKQLLEKFMENLFVDPDTAERITMRVGVFTDAQKEPDIEERFARAKNAAGNAEKQTGSESGKYTIVVTDGEA